MDKIIKTKKGEEIVVDSWNYDWLSQFTWYLNNYGYAMCSVRESGKNKYYMMHRLINKQFGKMQVDHINRIRTDNREKNLRAVFPYQNSANASSHKDSKVRYRGVSYCKRDNKYKAQICSRGEKIFIGRFECQHDAARAYNKKSEELHGVYGSKNVITKE